MTLKERVTIVVLNENLTKEERSLALLPLAIEHRDHHQGPIEDMMNDWNNMMADIVVENNLRRH